MPTAKEYREQAKRCLILAKEAKDLYAKEAMAELAEEFSTAAELLEHQAEWTAGRCGCLRRIKGPRCKRGVRASMPEDRVNIVDALRGQQQQLKRLIAQKMWISDAPQATLSEIATQLGEPKRLLSQLESGIRHQQETHAHATNGTSIGWPMLHFPYRAQLDVRPAQQDRRVARSVELRKSVSWLGSPHGNIGKES